MAAIGSAQLRYALGYAENVDGRRLPLDWNEEPLKYLPEIKRFLSEGRRALTYADLAWEAVGGRAARSEVLDWDRIAELTVERLGPADIFSAGRQQLSRDTPSGFVYFFWEP